MAVPLAVLVTAFIVLLAIIAIYKGQTRKPLELSDELVTLPGGWPETVYPVAVTLFQDTDRAMWQIMSIFLPASLILMGLVVSNLEKLDLSAVAVAGSASVSLVAIATVFKLRLREFNLLHADYIVWIERAWLGQNDIVEKQGLFRLRKDKLRAKGVRNFLTSIHGIIDIYLFVFIGLWVALGVVVHNRPVDLP